MAHEPRHANHGMQSRHAITVWEVNPLDGLNLVDFSEQLLDSFVLHSRVHLVIKGKGSWTHHMPVPYPPYAHHVPIAYPSIAYYHIRHPKHVHAHAHLDQNALELGCQFPFAIEKAGCAEAMLAVDQNT